MSSPGFHTVFANMDHHKCSWSLPISFEVTPKGVAFVPVPALPAASRVEPIDLTPVLAHNITDIFTRRYTEPRSPLCTLSIPDNLLGGWANIETGYPIDDTGLRRAGGLLRTPLGVDFHTPPTGAPNCVFLSWFQSDRTSLTVPLSGRATGLYLLVTGSTLRQCSRMRHALVTVGCAGGGRATLPLRNPETWWPIEQDYLLDDYLFVNTAPLPPRVDLRTGETRLLDPVTFKGKGRRVPGGAATIFHLPLDPAQTLATLKVEVDLYGIVVALLAATLARPA